MFSNSSKDFTEEIRGKERQTVIIITLLISCKILLLMF